jgi:hypothetical protein
VDSLEGALEEGRKWCMRNPGHRTLSEILGQTALSHKGEDNG